ncbi:MAG: acetyl-CoA C-acyltransferase [Aquabacterium sp.]|uniref:acetyl-CoA C-acyltransferase n=1 Tax=Aquabacterium sp. TaxID=1872578 RepID=UPI001225CB48|nr:acetyl-CoA C-acyltransferase [Aquabacterium sp.]TAK87333.1 MAG: acetyl-CoA C-acyltransferase [Aquabacterium sp.]
MSAQQTDPIVIVGATRTPIGAFQGQFQSTNAATLGGAAIAGALAQAGLSGSAEIGEVLMGCCLMAGLGQAPARQASIAAGLPNSVGATTLSKMCGSGMKTVMLAHDQLRAGVADFFVAGGMESMTNSPYLLPAERAGQRLGHGRTIDHMFFDGLQDAYGGELMGHYADQVAEQQGYTRAQQDAYATDSVLRARAAVEAGLFKDEITPVTLKGRGEAVVISQDETPSKCQPDKITRLKPAFRPDGTVTPASSASISDGAAALVLTRASVAQQRGQQVLARIVAHSTYAAEPGQFATAPVPAIQRVLDKAGWQAADVDLFEVNEAFAIVALHAMRELGLPHDKVNVAGGACALGHPIGATGARIIVTLIHALRRTGGRRGVASLCIGGGEATAMAIEIPA